MIYPNEKDLSKLKQLDRIEYRQKIDNIEKNNLPIDSSNFLILLLGTISFLALSFIGMYNINSSTAFLFLSLAKLILTIGFFIYIMLIIVNIGYHLKSIKQKRLLILEYFDYVGYEKKELKKK